MSATAALAVIAITLVALAAITGAAIRYLSAVLEEENEEERENGPPGTAAN